MIDESVRALLAASPLTLALVILILLLTLLLLIVYRLVPYLVTKRENERRGWDRKQTETQVIEYAKYSRVEEIAARVHRLTSTVGGIDLLTAKIHDLEGDMKDQNAASGVLRDQIADLVGTTRELHVKVDGVADRMDRDTAVIGARLASLEEMIREMARTVHAFAFRAG